MFFSRQKSRMPTEAEALPGRETAIPVPDRHAVKDAPLAPPFPDGLEQAQQKQAEASRDAYQHELDAAGYGPITTEIREAPAFWYAEDYHQQYLHKVPGGYCGMGGTGVSCPVGVA
jgi:hypothetical protein